MALNHWWKHVSESMCRLCVYAIECLGVCVSPRVPVRGGRVRGERERPKASVCPGPSGSAEEPPCSGDTLFPAYTFSSSVYTPVIYEWRHDQLVNTQSLRCTYFEGPLLCGPSNSVRPESTDNITSIHNASCWVARALKKLQLYLHDWGQGTRGRRFHLLTASPPGCQIHRHEFLKHNKAWTVTHGHKASSFHPPPAKRERGWRRAEQRGGVKGKSLAPGVSNGNGKQGNPWMKYM